MTNGVFLDFLSMDQRLASKSKQCKQYTKPFEDLYPFDVVIFCKKIMYACLQNSWVNHTIFDYKQ